MVSEIAWLSKRSDEHQQGLEEVKPLSLEWGTVDSILKMEDF